mmetsp:Transcript_14362/g.42120  ORF Transcript_14362/g.42120 Transcript_14362/m.42120 type:complete len:265 (-) Transcript_14362:278-1072(-)
MRRDRSSRGWIPLDVASDLQPRPLYERGCMAPYPPDRRSSRTDRRRRPAERRAVRGDAGRGESSAGGEGSAVVGRQGRLAPVDKRLRPEEGAGPVLVLSRRVCVVARGRDPDTHLHPQHRGDDIEIPDGSHRIAPRRELCQVQKDGRRGVHERGEHDLRHGGKRHSLLRSHRRIRVPHHLGLHPSHHEGLLRVGRRTYNHHRSQDPTHVPLPRQLLPRLLPHPSRRGQLRLPRHGMLAHRTRGRDNDRTSRPIPLRGRLLAGTG